MSSKECGFAIRCFGYDPIIPWYFCNSNDDVRCMAKLVLFVGLCCKVLITEVWHEAPPFPEHIPCSKAVISTDPLSGYVCGGI